MLNLCSWGIASSWSWWRAGPSGRRAGGDRAAAGRRPRRWISSRRNRACSSGKMCRFAEALRMQMEVQRKLEQKMEVQRHLQMRIEAQGRYLQSVLNKAKETQHHLLHSASDHSSLSKAKQKVK
ncbi:myb family transcription factor APL-like isoform X2 [Salvia miltiorrhiza]|uniref:myb family transcription factor APL-like isoform X2 n=1 Tax=Salvia miltiorrhiza TaxID=226208 RepID=UPI0025AC4441|nr:myb family transcription factor APL-like isoform X2 [Salvia miltiorrhiza]